MRADGDDREASAVVLGAFESLRAIGGRTRPRDARRCREPPPNRARRRLARPSRLSRGKRVRFPSPSAEERRGPLMQRRKRASRVGRPQHRPAGACAKGMKRTFAKVRETRIPTALDGNLPMRPRPEEDRRRSRSSPSPSSRPLAVDGLSGLEGAGNAERWLLTGAEFEKPGCRAGLFRAVGGREVAGEARPRGFQPPGGRLSHRSERVIEIRKSRTVGQCRNAENRRIRSCTIYT